MLCDSLLGGWIVMCCSALLEKAIDFSLQTHCSVGKTLGRQLVVLSSQGGRCPTLHCCFY